MFLLFLVSSYNPLFLIFTNVIDFINSLKSEATLETLS